jgi:putative restriction endonuclease
MRVIASRMTADEYYAVSVEGDRKQLVDGELVVSEPKPIHALLQIRLSTEVQRWVEAGDGRGLALMPTDVKMDEHNVYGPDVLWFAEEHRPADLGEYADRVPDLCVEIRSPGTWRYDVGAKERVYEERGLPGAMARGRRGPRPCCCIDARRPSRRHSTWRSSSAWTRRSPRLSYRASRCRSGGSSRRQAEPRGCARGDRSQALAAACR